MGDDGKENMISREVKLEIYERVLIPTMVYDSEMWTLSTQERRKIEVFELMCLRNMFYKESGQSKTLIINKREARV